MVKEIYGVGCSVIDITPPIGGFLAGYANRNTPSNGIYHPLRAVSTIIDDGRSPLLLVSMEWLGFYDRTTAARHRIATATGINPAHIVLSGTHTHCGPVMRRNMDVRRHGTIDESYIDRTLDALAQSAIEAMNRRTEAHLRTGTDWCGFAASRRRPAGPNKVVYKPSRDAPHDHEVSVIAIESLDGHLRQLLFSYACHPITAGALTYIGGDFVSFACDYLEQHYKDITACFFQGCAGDQKADIRDTTDDSWRDLGLDEVETLGQRLGQSVQRVVDIAAWQVVSGPISIAQRTLTLHTEPTKQNILQAAATTAQKYVREWAEYHLDLERNGEKASTEIEFEIQTIRFGQSLLIITMAGEMSVEYSLGFKYEWSEHFDQVWPLGYTNNIVGYVPVQRQIPEGGYEVVDNNRYQLYTGPFVEKTEAQIRAAVRKNLTTDQACLH